MTSLDVLAAAIAATLAPASAADLLDAQRTTLRADALRGGFALGGALRAHRPDPGIDDDDEDERPIGDPDDDDEGFDDDEDEDDDDEEPLQVSGGSRPCPNP